MNPKHTSLNVPREKGGEQFYGRAPYNFVPLPEQVVTVDEPPDHDHYEGNTGYIECELETKSPLYVRGMMTQTTFEKYGDSSFDKLPPEEKEKRAQFFMLRENEPVIPGSCLRGMIRALVEMVGYGKMQPVTDKEMLFRAVGDPASLGQYYRAQMLGISKVPSPNTQLDYPSLQLRGGYLRVRDGRRFIQPAMQHQGESIIHVEYADAQGLGIQQGLQSVYPIFVMPASRKPSNRGQRGQGKGNLTLDIAISPQGGVVLRDRNQQPKSGMVEAVLVVSGHMGGQHPKHWHCAIYAPDPNAKLIPIPDPMWKTYEEDRDETRGFPPRKLTQDGDPLFYLVDDKEQLRFFGPTMMFRLPYLRTANDFVPERLRRDQDIDLAEAMFGHSKGIGEGKQRAYASRVFVSDAVLETGQANVWFENQEVLTPKILSSPKPTTFQHYLVQTDAEQKKNLKHYASETPAETVIRGHKLYWHKGEVSRQDIELEAGKDRQQLAKQLTGIKPVRAGVAFKFRVHFENLNDAELGALLWVLGLPEGYCQSLGMGKPLGMGAVKITPTLCLSDRHLRYTRLFENDKWADGVHQETDRGRFTRAFEKFMLDKMDAADKDSAMTFSEVERIQMLLKMLEFPGPDRDWTRYMTIEPENEFKERPVLPDPLHILPSSSGGAKPTPKPSVAPQGRSTKPPASQQGRAPKTSGPPAEKKQAAPPQAPQSAAPASPYKVGETFNGTVRQVWKDGTFIIEASKLTYPKGYARVAREDAAGKGWKEGGNASCEVLSISTDEKGRIVLVCRAAAKKSKKQD